MKIDTQKKYPAKALLFGEHIVLKGSDALAIPLERFAGKWQYHPRIESAKLVQMDLRDFARFLEGKSGTVKGFDIDATAFLTELDKGIYFQSNIPLGYGAGSSGALCAAVYDVFGKEKTNDPLELKKIFALMESFFHGSSSGFDPLVCYLGTTVKLSKGKMKILNQQAEDLGLFLIDTGLKRNASDYIKIVMNKYVDHTFETMVTQEMVPATSHAIIDYLKGDAVSLFHRMHDISRLQYLHFNELVPDDMVAHWERGLRSDYFKMKICGAGGGGFMMGLTKDMDKVKALFGEERILAI